MDPSPGSPNDRRPLPRHIRDGEHESWQDAAEAGAPNPWRRWRLLLYVVLVAAVIVGLWLYNDTRA